MVCLADGRPAGGEGRVHGCDAARLPRAGSSLRPWRRPRAAWQRPGRAAGVSRRFHLQARLRGRHRGVRALSRVQRAPRRGGHLPQRQAHAQSELGGDNDLPLDGEVDRRGQRQRPTARPGRAEDRSEREERDARARARLLPHAEKRARALRAPCDPRRRERRHAATRQGQRRRAPSSRAHREAGRPSGCGDGRFSGRAGEASRPRRGDDPARRDEARGGERGGGHPSARDRGQVRPDEPDGAREPRRQLPTLGRTADAKRELETALQLDSTQAVAHYDLGLLYLFSPSVPGFQPLDQVGQAIKELETYKTMRGKQGPGQSDDMSTTS